MMDTNNLKIKAYNYIKNKIISGVYPPNQKIEESEISNELNFSRTPIREAINTLKDEGWITIIPRKGIFVSEISLKDINDILHLYSLYFAQYSLEARYHKEIPRPLPIRR